MAAVVVTVIIAVVVVSSALSLSWAGCRRGPVIVVGRALTVGAAAVVISSCELGRQCFLSSCCPSLFLGALCWLRRQTPPAW
ncbi:hypothetical protein BJV78DRAFT_1211418 [Lactifluus subvellereus]|nr:hypothetical protein BJV78DRAFT_1211418 [Lactifluus subvellereus]